MSTIDRTLKTGSMTAAELLPLIDPKLHPKFSPNLHAWIKKQFGRLNVRIVATNPDGFGRRGIGHMDEHGWIGAANLISVLCNGAKEPTWAIHSNRGIDQPFIDRYIRDGRCAIDPDHTMYFTDNSTRWAEEKHQRHCQWCGHHTQVKLTWSETIKLSEWVPA